MAIPELLPTGYLPPGLYEATEQEVQSRFGSATVRRQYLWTRTARWIGLGRKVGASKLLIDGSFVTAKADPEDVDAVVLLTDQFHADLFKGTIDAIELYGMMLNKEPEELFAAEDQSAWTSWIDFFSRVRENPNVRKGMLEVRL